MSKPENHRDKERVLNNIAIFLAKTYRIVDVLDLLYRTLPIRKSLNGRLREMDLSSKISQN